MSTRSYINFDEEVTEKINANTSSYLWGFFKADVEVNGETVELDKRNQIVVADDEIYKIFNTDD